MFAKACESAGWRRVTQVGWQAFLEGDTRWAASLGPDAILRIESSGEDFEVERHLLVLGAGEAGAHPEFESLSVTELKGLSFERGRVLPSRQWYLGWLAVLERIERLVQSSGCKVMNSPAAIAKMFDKAACHGIFHAAGIRTPPLIGQPRSFDELLAAMETSRTPRIFLKPCHSSSASGVIALETHARGMQAFTTLEQDGTRLYNSLRLRKCTGSMDIQNLVNAICRHRCIAETWRPKAGFLGGTVDLRCLVVGGSPGHSVLRHSKGPLTNLHLGNRRGELEAFRERIGPEAWDIACNTCVKAAGAFPDALYAGVDLLISPSFRNFEIAEINAFGDLLPNLEFEGMNTYELELRRLEQWLASREGNTQVSTMGL